MKTDTRILDVTSTLEGEKIGMTIDDAAMQHIMSVLTDLYRDPEMAVIREYSTNAFDAHIEAGLKQPIEVTLPTSLSPFFKVRDYGVGLDIEDIREIYSRYGASTKRESNEVVGMLGLGCKSALTYTDQFTLTGIKNGVLTQVSVSRDEDGSGSMTIVSQIPTDQPSGVEIIVPAKRGNYFEYKAKAFFKYWEEGTVLVNGKQPKRIDGMWITKDLLMTTELEQSQIIMGNVAYPVEDDSFSSLYGGSRYGNPSYVVVAFVEIGAVNFTPSRESLQMTSKTKSALSEIKERVIKERDASFEKQIAAAKNPIEAMTITANSKYMGFGGTAQYQGNPIPEKFETPEDELFLVVQQKKGWGSQGWSAEKTLNVMSFGSGYGEEVGLPKRVWFVNCEEESFSSYKRKKLVLWEEMKKGIDPAFKLPNHYVLVEKLPADSQWIDPKSVFDWSEVSSQKITRENAKRNDGRVSGSYEGWVAGSWSRSILASSIDTTKPIFWWDRRAGINSSILESIKEQYPDATILDLQGNRIKKFTRDFPMAEKLNDHFMELIKKWKKSLTDDQKVKIHLHQDRYSSQLAKLDPQEIQDPELKKAITLVSGQDTKLIRQFERFRHWVEGLQPTNWVNPYEKYPLLEGCMSRYGYGRMDSEMKNHIYLYVNAAYAAGKGN